MTDQELSAAIREVQERARARAPEGSLGVAGADIPNLMPLLHARDAAEAKVAAIGTVNPRPPGFANNIAQSVKRFVARALNWHVREQVEFNRASMACVQATLEALTSTNRALAVLAGYAGKVDDLDAWRTQFHSEHLRGEIHTLRAISELQAAYQHRLTVQEQSFLDALHAQRRDFDHQLERNTVDVQKKLWEDLQKIRQEYDRLIHSELRLLRQQMQQQMARPAQIAPAVSAASPATEGETFPIDWIRFAERFRGSEERIRAQQSRYVEFFGGTSGAIMDLGCGRGEFLAAARDAGLAAVGIDLNADNIAACTASGLDAIQADLFSHLESQPDGSVAGVYCAQVVEHLSPASVARLIELLGRKLRSGARVAIETPNPECLAIFATHFYIDPTHTRPVPAVLLRYYFEEAGFTAIRVEYLEPAVESLPELQALPHAVRDKFFGGLDYAIFATKL